MAAVATTAFATVAFACVGRVSVYVGTFDAGVAAGAAAGVAAAILLQH